MQQKFISFSLLYSFENYAFGLKYFLLEIFIESKYDMWQSRFPTSMTMINQLIKQKEDWEGLALLYHSTK